MLAFAMQGEMVRFPGSAKLLIIRNRARKQFKMVLEFIAGFAVINDN
jgi:hypothetical protein